MQRGPREKRERSLGEHLHLKGQRCDSPKCAAVKKPYRPGAHGQDRRRKAPSDFARQLAEKQKFKVVYGLHEKNLRRLFAIAEESETGTDRKLVELLERRLDNIIYRMGLAPSRFAARQLVVQGHIKVNGRRVKSPGYTVKTGDNISVREESKAKTLFKEAQKRLAEYQAPAWLFLDSNKLEGKVVGDPQTEDVPFEANLLVESFSK